MEIAPTLDEATDRRPVYDYTRRALRRTPVLRLYGGPARGLSAHGAGLIVTPNLDHLRLLSRSRALRRTYASADVIVNDSRFLDRLAYRGRALCLPGSELAPELLARLEPGSRTVVVGADQAIHAFLAHSFPRLTFVFVQPSMGYIRHRDERRRLVREVLQARAACVFVCTGAPQSELFAAQLKRAGCGATLLCCGSAFHFLSGAAERAPEPFRRAGAEWLWRFAHEARTRERYVADAAFLLRRLPAFVALRLTGRARFPGFVLHAR